MSNSEPNEFPQLSFIPAQPDEGSSHPGMLVCLSESNQGEGLIVDPEVVRSIPEDLIMRYRVVPVRVEGNKLHLAMQDTSDLIAIDDISLITGYDVIPIAVEESVMVAFLYGSGAAAATPKITASFPLQSVEARVRLTGPCASVWVTQTFANPFAEPIEATYMFPLPEGAAVHDFLMVVGQRTVRGEIQEKKDAQVTYSKGLAAGHRAGLLEKTGDDLLEVRVGNVAPGEQVKIEFRYAQKLWSDELHTTFRFPTVAPPRFGSGELAQPLMHPEDSNGARLSLTVDLETGGLMPREIASSQHLTTMRAGPRGNLRLELQNPELLNRDFILRYRIQAEKSTASLMSWGEYFLVNVLPPEGAQVSQQPRDLVFLIDRSGSMGGIKMESAKKAVQDCLERSTDQDRFALVAFDDGCEAFRNGELSRDLEGARKWLSGIEAHGGTRIETPLMNFLGRKSEPGRTLSCVLVTDGQVSNEAELLRRVQAAKTRHRIFTLGIDTCVNESFLTRLAELGGGSCERVLPKGQESGWELQQALRRIDLNTRCAIATDLTLHDRGLNHLPASLNPQVLPDLFAGRAVTASGRRLLPSASVGGLELSGQLGNGQEWRVALVPEMSENAAIGVLWARDRVRNLEDRLRVADAPEAAALIREIVGLSLSHGLLTRHTSFVLVDEAEVVDQAGVTVGQPQEFPAAWSFNSLFGVTDMVEVEETVKDISAQDFGGLDFDEEISLDKLKTLMDAEPIQRVVALILNQARVDRATHIHIEPKARSTNVRYRVDGILHDVMSPPKHIEQHLMNRILELANLKLGASGPQGGRAVWQGVHLWISSCPTRHGPKVVVEFYPERSCWPHPRVGTAMERALASHGVVLVAGLARSGFRELLHRSALHLGTGDKNVLYWDERAPLLGDDVTQLALNSTTSEREIVESLNGQDLDALVVRPLGGALPGLLTAGHRLVVAGVTASNARDALAQVNSWGVCGSIQLVVAQRRLRKACGLCQNQGCDSCHHTGFHGELNFFELLPVSAEMQKWVESWTLEQQIEEALCKGWTTLEELKRVGLQLQNPII